MAYLRNEQFKVLDRLWMELNNNQLHCSTQAMEEFTGLLNNIADDKKMLNERARLFMAKKRENNPCYGR